MSISNTKKIIFAVFVMAAVLILPFVSYAGSSVGTLKLELDGNISLPANIIVASTADGELYGISDITNFPITAELPVGEYVIYKVIDSDGNEVNTKQISNGLDLQTYINDDDTIKLNIKEDKVVTYTIIPIVENSNSFFDSYLWQETKEALPVIAILGLIAIGVIFFFKRRQKTPTEDEY